MRAGILHDERDTGAGDAPERNCARPHMQRSMQARVSATGTTEEK
jgi:hypothetical protein